MKNIYTKENMAGIAGVFFGLSIIVIFIVAGITMIYISNKIGSSDTKKDVAEAIKTITIANVILISLLGIVSYIYVNNNPIIRPNYTLIMIHLSLLLSLTAVSISSIEKFS